MLRFRFQLLLIISLVACGWLPAQWAEAQPSLKELQRARLNAANQTYAALSKMRILAARDRVSRLESMHSWSQRIMSIELESAGDDGRQTIAAYDRHYQRMADLETRIADRAELGQTSQGEIEASRFYMLDAQHARSLIRAQLTEGGSNTGGGSTTTSGEAEQLVISIDRVSNYFLGKSQVSKEELAVQLAAYEPGPDPKPVIVRIDKQAAVIRRAEVIELLKALKLKYTIQDTR